MTLSDIVKWRVNEAQIMSSKKNLKKKKKSVDFV